MEHYKKIFSNSTTDPNESMAILNHVWSAGTAMQLVDRLESCSNKLEDLDNQMDKILECQKD
jgi:hypothetical protein